MKKLYISLLFLIFYFCCSELAYTSGSGDSVTNVTDDNNPNEVQETATLTTSPIQPEVTAKETSIPDNNSNTMIRRKRQNESTLDEEYENLMNYLQKIKNEEVIEYNHCINNLARLFLARYKRPVVPGLIGYTVLFFNYTKNDDINSTSNIDAKYLTCQYENDMNNCSVTDKEEFSNIIIYKNKKNEFFDSIHMLSNIYTTYININNPNFESGYFAYFIYYYYDTDLEEYILTVKIVICTSRTKNIKCEMLNPLPLYKGIYPNVCDYLKKMHIPIQNVKFSSDCTFNIYSRGTRILHDDKYNLYRSGHFQYFYTYFNKLPVSPILNNFCEAIKINANECLDMFFHINQDVKKNHEEAKDFLKTCMGSYYKEAGQPSKTDFGNIKQKREISAKNKATNRRDLLIQLEKSVDDRDQTLCTKTYEILASFDLDNSIKLESNSKQSIDNSDVIPTGPTILIPSHQRNDIKSASSNVKDNAKLELSPKENSTESESNLQENTTISAPSPQEISTKSGPNSQENTIISAPCLQVKDTELKFSATIFNSIYGVLLSVLTFISFYKNI
ncbi:conserved protein, unknown function [Hepatocystis sp. ex Piliocolobus tephrosceles]|nr:conserved protein, unknown function [Hepatocystis sp. ex Piliocolobus tephrosceles]